MGRVSLFLAPITAALAALVGCSRGYNVYRRPLTPSERLTDRFELDVRGECRDIQDAVNRTHEAAVYHCARWASAAEYWVTRQPACEQGTFSSLVEIRCR